MIVFWRFSNVKTFKVIFILPLRANYFLYEKSLLRSVLLYIEKKQIQIATYLYQVLFQVIA